MFLRYHRTSLRLFSSTYFPLTNDGMPTAQKAPFLRTLFPVRLHLSITTIFTVRTMRLTVAFTFSLLAIASSGRAQQPAASTPPGLYTQGDPADNEQYLLGQLNRARLDPAGEGQRLP